MSLKEKQLFGIVDKVKIAIARFLEFVPEMGYYLAFSGGKDSITIKRLADMAGVKYDAHYNVTSIDPPDLIYFMREHHPDVIWDRFQKVPLLRTLETKGFPLRHKKWCCDLYKERGGEGRFTVTGLRRAESDRRKKNRRMVEACYSGKRAKRILNVIIDWTDKDVWDFIKMENLPYCKLYDEGWKRIGCLMCPNATPRNRKEECDLYPSYERAFRRSFSRLWDHRKAAGKTSINRWTDSDHMFDWWLSGKGNKKADPKQVRMFE